MRNKIIIYGGSSLISKYLFFEFYKNDYEFIVFCRDKKKVILHVESLNLDPSRFAIHSLGLEQLDENLKIIDSLNFKIKGIVWVAGYIGKPNEEIVNSNLVKNNYYINLINPILFINYLIPKLSENSFISVVTSVAGTRGRSKRLFYGSAKAGLINYLSGLRQFLFKKGIFVNTIIPGYIDTERFNIKAPKYLITSPKRTAKIIYQ
jgi:short-subunit dehydrogenase